MQYPHPLRSVLLALSAFSAISVAAGPIEEMLPGEWYEVPDSRLDGVMPDPLPAGSSGIASVMMAWSGGAYDTKRERLIVWGGGHTDYSGNEIYTFDIATLKWSRINDPSADVGGVRDSGVYPDGIPRARHTFNSIQYVPALDRFCAFGSGALYPDGLTSMERTDCFDFSSKQWERKANAKTFGIGNFSAVDPVTGMVWAGKGILTRFDPLANVWDRQTEYDNDLEWTDYLTLEADPDRRQLVGVGSGKVYQWDIANPDSAVVPKLMETTGGDDFLKAAAPGLAYDPIGEQMVAWGGGSDVFTLNPETRVWTRHARTGGAVPTSAEFNGTFGRFRYIASRNVFILVNRTDENVFIFKLSAGPEQPVGIKSVPNRMTSRPSVILKGSQVRFRRGGDWDARGRASIIRPSQEGSMR